MTDWAAEFAGLLTERTGLQLSGSLLERLAGVLTARVAAVGVSAADYVRSLQEDRAPDEMQQLINVLTVCKTSFWRYPDHVRAVVDELLPALHRVLPAGLPVNIWSTACATGEEPYTLAMALHAAGWYERRPINILATDINTDALAHARAGRYALRTDDSETIPATAWPYFTKEGGRYVVVPQIARRVEFRHFNLRGPVYPNQHAWHIVLCANVLIYFPVSVVLDVIRRLSENMAPNAALLLGGAESLPPSVEQLTVLRIGGAFVYAKGEWGQVLRRFEIATRRGPRFAAAADLATSHPLGQPARTAPAGSPLQLTDSGSHAAAPRLAAAHRADTVKPRRAPPPANDAHAARQLALSLFEKHRFENALPALEDAVTADPLAFDLHFYIGWILRRRDERQDAMDAFRRALFLEPAFSFARYEFALTLHELGFFDDAVHEYLRAERTAADPALAHALDALGSRRDPFWSNSQLIVELCQRNRSRAEQKLEPWTDRGAG